MRWNARWRLPGSASLPLPARREAARTTPNGRMTLLGLVGTWIRRGRRLPPRSVPASTAGILPIMITGDHPLTAVAVASEIGMLGDRRVLTGRELDA